MVGAASAIQPASAGRDAQRIQRAPGEVAGGDIDRAADEGEDAGGFGQAIGAQSVVVGDRASSPTAGDVGAEGLLAVIVLAPRVQVEVAGDEDVLVEQHGRPILLRAAQKDVIQGGDAAEDVDTVQVEGGQVELKAVLQADGSRQGGKSDVAQVTLAFGAAVA